ncbi:GNAT family N-acetyltransferase [Cardiobacteriaceae bacterium TAE3-ERU3]|nr:GNAT family N-acetyltransferase [Cardiobacteriaceae bacterium TAE3-ERU3]
MIHIKQAELADINVIANLFNQYRVFYGQATDLPLAKAFIGERMDNNESVLLLALDEENNALGFTQLYPNFSSVSACRVWTLNDLFVVQAARGQGVGRALMNAAKAYAKQTGARRLVLETAADNHTAQRLYESLGYQRESGVFHYSLSIER